MRPSYSHILTGVQLLTLLSAASPADKTEGVQTNQTTRSEGRLNQVTVQHETSHLRGPEKGDCVQLQTKRYISDGPCNSARPVVDVICLDTCYVLHSLSDASQPKLKFEQWQCKKETTRRHKVKLICKDGSRRFYFVRLVTKCTCEKKQLSSGGKKSKPEQKMMRKFEKRIRLS